MNEVVEIPNTLLTVMLMMAVPVMLVVGVIRRARFTPVPPMTMFSFGTKDLLEELAVRTKSNG